MCSVFFFILISLIISALGHLYVFLTGCHSSMFLFESQHGIVVDFGVENFKFVF